MLLSTESSASDGSSHIFFIRSLKLMKLRFYSQWLAQIMLYVTAGHEQAGAVEVPLVTASTLAF